MTSPRAHRSLELFRDKYNCSQAVFAAFREPGLGESEALRIATAFGAGGAATGAGLCGAVAGGMLAISSRHGRALGGPNEAKAETYALCRRFMSEFTNRLGSCNCRDVIGMDLGVAGNMKKAEELNLFATKCKDAVSTAGEILEELGI